ncbi:MAG TPA: two-component regulator propeller domain-containing protein, partial [Oligoflexia bacterium]|nr:two-component regulator propeller domain-containing protein [Oligoflexia bacterium]
EEESAEEEQDKPSAPQAAAPLPKPSGPFQPLPYAAPNPVAIENDAEGNIWLAHRGGLVIVRGGKIDDLKVVMDRSSYDADFNEEMPVLSTIGILSDKRIWAGFANGQVMQYERYEWKILTHGYEAIKGPVNAIADTGKEIFVASYGLFKFDNNFRRFLPDPEFRERSFSAFFTSRAGTLLMGGASGVYAYNKEEHAWSNIWKPMPSDKRIRTIYQDHDGTLLIGTSNGLVRLSEKGFIAERLLQGDEVSAVATETDGKIWAGTRKNGLKYWNGERWHIAGEAQGLGERIATLSIDKTGRIWAGLDGKGVLIAPLAEAKQWMSAYPEQIDTTEKPLTFANMCTAVEQLLKVPAVSGDITAESIDGRTFVFLRGFLVCPAGGAGFRRVDGTIVLIQGRSITKFADQSRTDILVPEYLPTDKAEIALLDSRDRLWIGTNGAGVLLLDGQQWQRIGAEQELDDNPITAIHEDADGNIWIGTSPRFDEAQRQYLYSNLHLFNDQGWFHYNPKQGLIFNNTQTLATKKDGTLVVGSMAGYSLVDKQGQVTNFGEDQGLEPRYVAWVTVDNLDRLWIAHNYFGDGITVVGEKKYHRIDSGRGLFTDRISRIGIDRSNRVWLLASNGTAGVYPQSVLKKIKTSRPILTKRVVTRNMFQ